MGISWSPRSGQSCGILVERTCPSGAERVSEQRGRTGWLRKGKGDEKEGVDATQEGEVFKKDERKEDKGASRGVGNDVKVGGRGET